MSKVIVAMCQSQFGNATVSSKQVCEFVASRGLTFYPQKYGKFRVSHGNYNFSGQQQTQPNVASINLMSIGEVEDESAIDVKLRNRFKTLLKLTKASAEGMIRSLIVSGPGGLGKSYSIENVVNQLPEERVCYIKGYVRPTGLYRALYENRFSKNVVVFDDADSIFSDETSLNLLKAACDSSNRRRMSWLSQREIIDEGGDPLPSSFEFEGTVIFITNTDFRAQVDNRSKLSPHFEAMMSRSHYLDLGIKTKTEYIVRIRQVVADGMLSDMTKELRDDIIDFISTNRDVMNELSLRMALKLADLARVDPIEWKIDAQATCMRT